MPKSSPSKEAIALALQNSFGGGRVLVVGDIMLDRYLWGTIQRISPEAPTPILSERRESLRAGGAGNVALNLAGLGLQVAVGGFVGNDEGRKQLKEIIAAHGIDGSAIVTLPDRATTIKTRVIAGHQHVLRLDSENLSEIDERQQNKLLKSVLTKRKVDAVILSDYGKGVLSYAVCQQIIEAARKNGIAVLVKPNGANFSKYAGASVMVMNQGDLAKATPVSQGGSDQLLEAAQEIVKKLRLKFLVVTRGADGISLLTGDQAIHLPTAAREVFDVSGAGDTAIATVAAGMLGGLDYADLLHTVNLAAGLVVARIGTVAVDRTSLLHELHAAERRPIASAGQLDELLPLIEEWRERNRRIVYAEGYFDGVHAGHIQYLQRAAREGDKLVVGVISEGLAPATTGGRSPRYSQEERASVVAALLPVDAVILCEEKASQPALAACRPDVVVERMDETVTTIAAAE